MFSKKNNASSPFGSRRFTHRTRLFAFHANPRHNIFNSLSLILFRLPFRRSHSPVLHRSRLFVCLIYINSTNSVGRCSLSSASTLDNQHNWNWDAHDANVMARPLIKKNWISQHIRWVPRKIGSLSNMPSYVANSYRVFVSCKESGGFPLDQGLWSGAQLSSWTHHFFCRLSSMESLRNASSVNTLSGYLNSKHPWLWALNYRCQCTVLSHKTHATVHIRMPV